MVLFKSLVNGKVANGGRENDRGNLGCSSLRILDPPRADPLRHLQHSGARLGRRRNWPFSPQPGEAPPAPLATSPDSAKQPYGGSRMRKDSMES